MIAKLKGTINEVFPGFTIVDVNGVGYKVEGYSALDKDKNQQIELYIYTHVREQEIRLFGFNTREELVLFEQLLGVSGVGPKAAIVLVTTLGIDTIISAIANAKPELLRVPGVGGKTGEKIVIELKNKIAKLGFKTKLNISESDLQKENEVTGALSALGYNQKEITAALAEIDYQAHDSQTELIKKALNYLRKK